MQKYDRFYHSSNMYTFSVPAIIRALDVTIKK